MMLELDKEKLRDLPGWKNNAPIPLCMGGDYRALTFCCKPGFSLTFAFKCRRNETLKELGIKPDAFIEIKEHFSRKNDWDSDIVCFGSLSYCCMRRGGCPKRDFALSIKYPEKTQEEFMLIYFQKKKELAKLILESVHNPIAKTKVSPYLDLF